MKPNQHNAGQRAQAIAIAWGKYAKDAKFAGMTLDQFNAATGGSTQGREDHVELKAALKGQREAVRVSDGNSRRLNKKVVAAVIADPDFGDDCPLYAAIGLVPASVRASGLTRKNGNGNGNGQPH